MYVLGNQQNDRGEQIDTKSDQWFGATVTSAGIDGPVVVSSFLVFLCSFSPLFWTLNTFLYDFPGIFVLPISSRNRREGAGGTFDGVNTDDFQKSTEN